MIRGAIWAFQSQPPTTAIAVTAVLTAIAALVGFPFMVPYSCFIALFCERQPLHHDKAKHFPGHTALETAWREIRREFEDVVENEPIPDPRPRSRTILRMSTSKGCSLPADLKAGSTTPAATGD